MDAQQEQEILFWGALLQPALCKPPDDERTIRSILLDIAQKQIRFPSGEIKNPTLPTMYRYLGRFRKKKLIGLARQKRVDQGHTRALSAEVQKRAIDLKTESPRRSARDIALVIEHELKEVVSLSTLNRFFRQNGLTRARLNALSKPVRCRWSREYTHDMWVGDFQDGPRVLVDGRPRKSYLSLLIDVHSRFVISGEYYLNENFEVFTETMIDGWTQHGKSCELYLDNAKVYRSPRLRLACIDLGIHLRHRAPKDPEGGGIVERLFKTSQDSFESEVRILSSMMTLDKLNSYFKAWLHERYHKIIHSEIGECPADRYKSGLRGDLNIIDTYQARKLFYKRIERTVNGVFSDLEIDGQYYRVDKKYRTMKVQVRYDTKPPITKVYVYGSDHKYLCDAPLHDRSEGEDGDPLPPKIESSSILEMLKEKFEQTKSGTPQAPEPLSVERKWTFTVFIERICRLKGLQSISSLPESDMEQLKEVFDLLPPINQSQLKLVYARCSGNDLLELIEELYTFKEELACSKSNSI